MPRDRRTRRDRHALDADGMVVCNPRDREAAHRAEVEGIATTDVAQVTCKKCLARLRAAAPDDEDERPADLLAHGYLRSIALRRDAVPSFDRYPFSIPAIASLDELALHPRVTFLVGENGSGKSTLIEALAIACGFNAEGGSRNFHFATHRSESELHRYLRIARGVRRPKDGFFLRAESYFNVGTEIERIGGLDAHYGGPVHQRSHGESFLALATYRFRGEGLYLLDEPEAALSPSRQLAFLAILGELTSRRASQLVIATHSPILMAFPDARILLLDGGGVREVAYEDTEHVRITRDFLNARELFLEQLGLRVR